MVNNNLNTLPNSSYTYPTYIIKPDPKKIDLVLKLFKEDKITKEEVKLLLDL